MMKGFLQALLAIALALSLSGCGRHETALPSRPMPAPTPEEDALRNGGLLIAYDGEDGKTALELLKIHARAVTTSASGLGELVETINGVGARDGNGYHLLYYVNGSMAKTGAGNYVTKTGDKIEWKIVGPHKKEP
jgi:hypothetical protein